jgi:nucleotide-binding universal stress UspA family protein
VATFLSLLFWEVDSGMNMRVVVGIGEREFTAPLKWAIDELYSSGASLFVTHCVPERLSTELPYPIDDKVEKGRALVDDAVAFARERGASVVGEVREGFAGEILVAISVDAGLLVVGSPRVRHGLHVPGSSVVTYCIRHAPCPVTIVPMGERLVGGARRVDTA